MIWDNGGDVVWRRYTEVFTFRGVLVPMFTVRYHVAWLYICTSLRYVADMVVSMWQLIERYNGINVMIQLID